MKCRNCGTKLANGGYCPECGTKIEDQEKSGQIAQQFEREEEKVPWYLSIWFIILICVFSFGILWIPAAVLGVIRFCKYKKRRAGVAFLDIVLIVPCVIVIISMILDAQKDGQLNRYIKSGQYAEAQIYIEQEYDEGSQSYTKALALLYETQGLYDEAACLWLEYYKDNYSLLELSNSAISKLKGYTENHGEALREESISQIQTLIADKERAEVEEQAAREAKEAEKQAERETKEAEKQAAREAKEAEKQAAKEAKIAEKQATKEVKEEDSENLIAKEEKVNNDNLDTEKASKKRTGHFASDQFSTESEAVLAKQIFQDFSQFDYINLIDFTDNEGSYDKVRAVMSHYDERGLVGIEYTCDLFYSGTDHYYRHYEMTDIREEKLDLSGLEGRSINISEEIPYYQMDLVYLFDIYDYRGVEEVDGTLTFHNMDRVESEIEMECGMVVCNYIYSKKPVVRVEATIDGKHYEGDFCLGVNKEWPYNTTKYIWLENEGWRFDVELERDKGDELYFMSIDLGELN